MDELALLKAIVPMLPARDDLAVGAGDDAAVIKIGDRLLLAAVDQLVENVHYAPVATAPEAAGAKLLKRNLSDIAAMGGVPAWCLVTLAADPEHSADWMIRFHRGVCAEAEKWGVAVAGGDLTSLKNGGCVSTLTILGTVAPEKLCLRKNAEAGDLICLTGELGRSFQTGWHLDFRPQLAEAAFLAGDWTRAMMDVSDGLAVDCARFAEASEVSFQLDLTRLPSRSGADASEMLGDGEDYGLLFTLPPGKAARLERCWSFDTPLTRIGAVLPAGDYPLIDLEGNRIKEDVYGYRHFR